MSTAMNCSESLRCDAEPPRPDPQPRSAAIVSARRNHVTRRGESRLQPFKHPATQDGAVFISCAGPRGARLHLDADAIEKSSDTIVGLELTGNWAASAFELP